MAGEADFNQRNDAAEQFARRDHVAGRLSSEAGLVFPPAQPAQESFFVPGTFNKAMAGQLTLALWMGEERIGWDEPPYTGEGNGALIGDMIAS